MWRYKDLPIQRKISMIIVIGMISAMVVTVVNFISFDRENVKRDLTEEMSVLARITAVRSAIAVAFGDRSNALENLTALSLRSTIQHACIYDEQDHLFAKFQRQVNAYPGCPDVLALHESAYPEVRENLLVVVEPILRKGKRMGSVLVASDLSPIAKRTRKWVTTSFFVTLAALLVAFLMTRRLQRSVVKPITDLADVMDRVRNSNNLSLRAYAHGQDEVGRLVDSFNDMLVIIGHHNRDLELLYRGLVEKSAEAEATAASLEVSNQHIKDLFGSAAHDLRQPLQAMAIFADTLRRKTSDPEQLAILDKLKQAMQNLASLFNEILDVSRYEFDLSVAGTQPTHVKNLLGKVFLEFEAMAQEKGLKLHFYSIDCTVIAHGALLERIIRNLLSNAIRYTERGGILLGCRRRGESLAIEVWDTGRGIPEQKQEQIFSKFVQVSAEDRASQGGFGLGLAIVRQFVDALGYQLSVRSRVGRGTVFRLLVPLAEDSQATSDRNGRGRSSGQGTASKDSLAMMSLDALSDSDETRILLIDDSETVRASLKLLLESWGFVVADCDSLAAVEAHRRLGGLPPSLVISDYQLADGETGDQAINLAKQLWPSDLPAFIISGAESSEVWQSIEATGYPVLRKPIKPARMRAMINHLIR